MTDREMIEFLWKLLLRVFRGDDIYEKEWDTLGIELFKRGLCEKEDDPMWGTY